MGQDKYYNSTLLRENIFRTPYHHPNLEWGENGTATSNRLALRPFDWEKNVDFLRNRVEKLSSKFVSTWSYKRVAYFVSSLPGIYYNPNKVRNGVLQGIVTYLFFNFSA